MILVEGLVGVSGDLMLLFYVVVVLCGECEVLYDGCV